MTAPNHPTDQDAAPAGRVRIMPLGDSITDGHRAYPGGYRVRLRRLLSADGHAVEFVGSLANGPRSLVTRRHEGHTGWRVDQVDAHVHGWLRDCVPHTVLLLIGTNDMNQNYDTAQAPARLARLLAHVRQALPDGEVFVATIPPQPTAARARRIAAYNRALPDVVAAAGPRVHLVPMHDALTPADLADGVHPSRSGHDKMAQVWHEALRSVPSALAPGTPAHPLPASSHASMSP
ncbi:SGNH hydrolase [Streptomyces sp. SID5785]|uniref:SGNH/GDSL hydrolase family protein n=1 Tax=Streptomyces sp. SID5785 TaxID=2690309 RepID=UPI001360E745|nr:SGNH/GDSL hydrolase family protein [Streptomyces sp. SID5785]MZD10045.1 SGNH hydrolase [Streptomyces sp. SID5785]